LVAEQVRKRLSKIKQTVKNMGMERFNLNKLSEGEVKEECQVTVKHDE
jgi:hypothetical protein